MRPVNTGLMVPFNYLSPRLMFLLSAVALFGLQQIDIQISNLFLLLLIAVFGVPHGMLDPWLAIENINAKKRVAGLFCLVYLAIAWGVFILWTVQPILCLILFLLLSSLHFGMDWKRPCDNTGAIQSSKGLSKLSSYNSMLLIGGSVLVLPLLAFPVDSFTLFSNLTGKTIWIDWRLLCGWLCVSVLYLCYLRHWQAIIDLALLSLVAYWFMPLEYFMLYFCAMHSWQHYQHHLGVINWRSQFSRLLFALIVITTVVLGYFAFRYLSTESVFDDALLQTIFWGVSALTVPHMMIVAHYNYRNQKG